MPDFLTIKDGNDEYKFKLSGEKLSGEKHGALAFVFEGIKVSSDEPVILKINQLNSKEARIVTQIRTLPDARKFLVPILVERVPDEQIEAYYPDASVHIEECAPGKNLENIYIHNNDANDHGISFNDRLHIALQAAEFFEVCNNNKFVYLDHKPADHIFWEPETRALKIIDWNAANSDATDQQLTEDFNKFCRCLPQILNSRAMFHVLDSGEYESNYDLYPFGWDIPLTEEKIINKGGGYGEWSFMTLLSLSTSMSIYANWKDIKEELSGLKATGKTAIGLGKIMTKVENDLPDHVGIVEMLQETIFKMDETSYDNVLAGYPKMVEDKAKQANRLGHLKINTDFEAALCCFSLARLLSPTNHDYYFCFELARLYSDLSYPYRSEIKKLVEMLLSRDNLALEIFSKKCRELALQSIKLGDIYKESTQVLNKLEKLTSAEFLFWKATESTSLQEKITFLGKSVLDDPDNQQVKSQLSLIQSNLELEKKFNTQLDKVEELLGNENEENLRQADDIIQKLSIESLLLDQLVRFRQLNQLCKTINARIQADKRLRNTFSESMKSWDEALLTGAYNSIIDDAKFFNKDPIEWLKLLDLRLEQIKKIRSLLANVQTEKKLHEKLIILQKAWEINSSFPDLEKKIHETKLHININRIEAFREDANSVPSLLEINIINGLNICDHYKKLFDTYQELVQLPVPVEYQKKATDAIDIYKTKAIGELTSITKELLSMANPSDVSEILNRAKEVGLL